MPLVRPSVYRHTQTTAATNWIIEHNIGNNGGQAIPMVDVLWDNAGTLEKIIPASIERPATNVVIVRFSEPRTGQAIIMI
jgi:hypothetical protein